MPRESGHVHFVYNGVGKGPFERRISFPIVCAGIDDHAFHGKSGIISRQTGCEPAIFLRNCNSTAIGIEQHFIRIEPMTLLRFKWSIGTICI